MPCTVMPLAKAQRVTLWRYAAFHGVTAVAAGVWTAVSGPGHTGGRSGYVGPIVVVLAALVALAELNIAFGRTVVEDVGLRTWRPLHPRTWRWDEIAAIDVALAKERYGSVSRLVVVTTGGRRCRLPAPMSAWWGLDGDFGNRHRFLRERLAVARGSASD